MRLTKQSSCPAPSVSADAGGGMTGNESFVTVNDDTVTLPNSRQITAGADIGIVDGGAGNPITINNSAPENTSVANVGTGDGDVYRDMTGDQVNLKTIKDGTLIDVVNNADDITINYTGPANVRVEQDNCVNAVHFVPAQSPFLPAPIEDYYIAASGFSGKVIRYNPGAAKSAASCFWSNRWVTRAYASNFQVYCQVNFFTDNASLNNVIFDLYQKSGSYPAFDLSTAPASIGNIPVVGVGAYKQNRVTFQFNTTGDNYQFVLERQVDTNPGTMYVQSILFYFGAALQ